MNDGIIKTLVTSCSEYHQRGSYGGKIPFPLIIKILKEAEHEIWRLQKEVDSQRTILASQSQTITKSKEEKKQNENPV
jgi:hypothetical protein